MRQCEARIATNDSQGLLACIRAAYGVAWVGAEDDGSCRIAGPYGETRIERTQEVLRVVLTAADDTSLAYVRVAAVRQLRAAAAPGELAIRWEGDACGPDLPYFREMRVEEAFDLTPRMRRIVLSGSDLARFGHGGLHVRLVLPPEGRAPRWPRMGEDGCPVWPDGEDAPALRVYTLREVRPERGEVVIDMLRHDGDETPGAGFAARARPGQVVGLSGPIGSALPCAASQILIGDETALPAIGRMLERLDAQASARVIVEVAGPEEEQPLPSRARVDITWLHRGRGPSLADSVEALDPGAFPQDTFLFAGCEFGDFARVRRLVRDRWAWGRERHHVTAYWRRGVAGEKARAES